MGISAVVAITLATCDSITREDQISGIRHPSGKEFAGSGTCGSCHPSIFASHVLTPHYRTSRPATLETVKGSFDSSRNTLILNERLKVVMEHSSEGLFQAGYIDGLKLNSRPMDIVVGSGRKGQTYLYWKDNQLFQLPVSYYTPLDQWCNSPGYPADQILFNRQIQGRCLECHGTYLKSEKSTERGAEVFDRSQVMLGVDCERCHGPAADHVRFHREHPQEREARNIINPARLSRQQKLDNCALCHSGIRESLKPSFSFTTGDTLDDYSLPDYSLDKTAALDVHGNQYGLLTASKCFRNSAMDCSSCHNVHNKETNNLELFSRRCMACHSPQSTDFCTMPEKPGLVLEKNCIDCHMPALPSAQILLQVSDQSKVIPDLVRTHLVGVYEEQIKMYLEKISRSPG